ncbi:tyrosine-type recombinase/integrase [Planctomicrobium sp. SH661]|uniref:tyrosine-type recombinase/integrase n=1 Tax=Planctomicrobium sp. SH661 TaxID=3448124 RepID=UPI003F5C77AB
MAQLPFPSDQGGPALKLWMPEGPQEEDPESPRGRTADTRTMHPGVAPANLFQQLADQHRTGPQKVSRQDLARIREQLTLPEFYAEFMAPYRATEKQSGAVKGGTLSKERQALNRWVAWETSAKPTGWPTSWKGMPIGYIQGGWLDQFFAAMSAKYAPDSIKSTRNHLLKIFNFAVEIGALESAPQSKPLDLEDFDDIEEDLATVWSEEELNRLYQAAHSHPDIQAALVLCCNCGPRAVDLFQTRWDKNIRSSEDPPRLRFRAIKTGKKHGIPLHPVVVAHLDRLKGEHLFDPSGLLFPRLSTPIDRNKDPEKSHAARRRNTLIKSLMKQAGVPAHEKPWQVCRATCCTRLNNVRLAGMQGGVGSWIIGQGSDRSGTKLAADFYDNPTEAVIQTVMAAPQPQAFLSVLH